MGRVKRATNVQMYGQQLFFIIYIDSNNTQGVQSMGGQTAEVGHMPETMFIILF